MEPLAGLSKWVRVSGGEHRRGGRKGGKSSSCFGNRINKIPGENTTEPKNITLQFLRGENPICWSTNLIAGGLQNSELQCFHWVHRYGIQTFPFWSSIELQFDGRGSTSNTTGSPSCQQEIKPPTLHVVHSTTFLTHTYWTENATMPHKLLKKNNYKQQSS